MGISLSHVIKVIKVLPGTNEAFHVSRAGKHQTNSVCPLEEGKKNSQNVKRFLE